MFAPQWTLLQPPFMAPLIQPYRTPKRVCNPQLSSEAISLQNTLRWFSQSRLCSALLKNQAEVEKVIFYTPPVREDLTVRNSCVWPATYDSKQIGVFGLQYLRYSVNYSARGKVISRGFKTKVAIARDSYNDQFEKKSSVLGSVAVTKKTEDRSERLKTMLQDNELSAEEQTRLRIAFAEGYRVSDGGQAPKKKWGFFSMTRDIVVLNVVLAIALFLFYGVKFKKVIIGSPNEVSPEEIDVTFDDVMGVEDAKQELQEIVEFLKNPKKFSHLGGKLPKGVLLVGPPGTGKTLLARAVAGEAGVPFFHAAGPEFDELLVGQGARRMRDLFQTAKVRAPCVIFIDEIDSVGAARSSSVLHPYANQTINQLLTEMDGFRQNEGVIVLGATNRRDDLDRALLRPGRFDVEVQVPRPDLVGRMNILEYYVSKVTVGSDVNINYLARGTTGFTGADIENMVNQAALRAAIDGKDSVTMAYFENARDKILMGPERKSRIPDKEDNLITAYHEGGHALVAYYSKESLPLHKVTIIARGPSLGHTAFIPSKDDAHLTKSQILARMDSMMGGRAAEELTFGVDKVTTGASTDLQKATELSTNMVKTWGMSEKVGERFFETKRDSLVVVNDISNLTSELIDQEIKRNLHESMERAKNILRAHQHELKLLAEALLKYETLDAKEVKQLLETGSLVR